MDSKIFKINYHDKELILSTNYRESGSELLFFIHGLGCAKESFDNAWDFSELDDFSLMSIDLLGFGNSSKPQDFSYSMEEQAEISRLLINKINPKKVHIVVHSMGGAIGILLAEKISEKLGTFINIEGNLIDEDCGLMSRKAAGVSYEKFRDFLFPQIKSFAKNAKDNGSNLWVKWAEKADDLGFYKSSQSLVELSDSGKLLKKYKDIKCKKIYFYGERSPVLNLVSKLQKSDDIKIISVPNSGHFVMNDNPEELYKTVAFEL